MSSFNPTQAVNSESYRFNAYVNYKYLGNTLCMTPEEFEAFEALYGSSFKDWDAKFESTDISEYDISDEDLNTSLDEGIAYTEEQTGFDEKDEINATGTTVGAAVGSLGSAGAAIGLSIGSKCVGDAIVSALEKKGVENIAKAAGVPFVIGAAICLATGTLNLATALKTNRDAAKALQKIAELMRGEGATAIQKSIDILNGLEADTVARTELAAINAEEHSVNADMITKAFLEGQSGVNDLLAEKADLEVQMKEKQELVLQKEAELETLQADPEKNAERIAVLQGEIGTLNGEIASLVEQLAANSENIKAFNDIFAILNEEYNTSKEENQTENETINEEIAAGAEKYNNERANIEFQRGKIVEEQSLHGNALAKSITNLVSSTVNVASSAIVAVKAFAATFITFGASVASAVMAIAGGAASATAMGFEIDNIVKIADAGDATEDFQGEIDVAAEYYEGSLTHYVANEELSISYEDVIAASEYEGEGAQAEG